MNYPKITRDKAIEFFVMLRHLADYIVIDCSAVFEADPASIVAIEAADCVLRLGTANLKGISYFRTHMPMLADSRFRTGGHIAAFGCLKVGQDWEAVSAQYGGADYILPYTAELERQDNELSLFQPLTEPESGPYMEGVHRMLEHVFGISAGETKKAGRQTRQSVQTMKKEKRKPAMQLRFGRSKGEF